MLQRWRAVGIITVSGLTGPRFEPQTSRYRDEHVTARPTGRFCSRIFIFLANTMQLSFQKGEAVSLPTAHSVASGLSPPFAGENCYEICKAFVDDIVTVNDRELATAARTMYEKGLVVEPAGAASFASIMFDKIPNLRGNVVALVTGGNATPQELTDLFKLIENC